MKKAIVKNGVIFEVFDVETVHQRYAKDFVDQLVDVPDSSVPGLYIINGACTDTPLHFGVVGTTLYAEAGCTPDGADWRIMSGPQPDVKAVAQSDGTWIVPQVPDLTLGEAENIVAMFPVSYGYVLERLGFGDVV